MWSDLSICVQGCDRTSQWNRSYSDTCQRTFRHIYVDDAGGHADFVGTDVFDIVTHVR